MRCFRLLFEGAALYPCIDVMWLTPAILCVLYVETYQEDVPHPFVFPFRSKQASAYPNYNVLISKLNAVPLHANIGPEKLSNFANVERKREKNPSEDSTQPSYVVYPQKDDEFNFPSKNKGESLLSVRTTDRDDVNKSDTLTTNSSVYADLELIKQFAIYLRKKTFINPPLGHTHDPGRQYTALLSVLMTLAHIVRRTCSNVDETFDKAYLPAVQYYYQFGRINPDKIRNAIEIIIKTGNSYIPKLLKLKTEVCKKYSPCSTILDKKINSHLAVFAKEVKTLELFVNIAKSYATVSREFSKVTQTGDVVTYLLNNKDKIKEFILDNVNYVDHIDENYLGCS
ncbi:hypothetical protein HW555_011568 [Spodoptera exigua]|uniref:Uncharacterized protein n=1 Tax=Spodoptera exigua TaxID=7107 RepID=A0A835G547_SPOEX|nr:hypothetical protein HW555_011568 [Spodoptera exigua]